MALESKSAKSHIVHTVSRGNTSKKEAATEISYLVFVWVATASQKPSTTRIQHLDSIVQYLYFERIQPPGWQFPVGEWEHIVVSNVKKMIPDSVKQTWHDWRVSMKKAEHEHFGNEEISDAVEMAGWGVEEAEEKNKMDASLATQLALAYAIHKSFIFIRVPIAVAVTPKVVKVLRGWGWDIGKRTTKEAKAIRRAHVAASPTKKKRARKP
ncbi:putative N-terminal acetyltransferase [Lachnellula willkommii]|uniref:Putative N-terminal acetyltransferase n=1 Tax=Lachnellula willkommii TaxID=215461 RepID=A0A559M727_9HELO|nr:putative N-terminal acetyltransferase [Lachnellula willkommii]